MQRFVRDLASVMLSKGAVIVFGLTNTVILARWLGPEKTGTMAALMVYPSLFMTFGSFGLRQAATYVVGKQLYAEKEIKRAIVQIWCLSTPTSLIACYSLLRYVSQSGDILLLALLAIAPIPFTLLNDYTQGLLLGRNDIRAFNRINWVPSVTILIATVGLVVALGAGLTGALSAAVAGPAMMSVILAYRYDFINAISLKIDWPLIRKMLSLGMVYAVALLAITLNYRLDVILMDQLSTDYELGIYSKGASLVEYMWQIPMLLSTIIFARSATAVDDAKFSRKVLQLLRVSVLIVGAASLVLMFTSNLVISLLFGSDFLPSASVLSILLPGVVLLTVFKVLNMDLAGKGKPWVSIVAMLPALVVNVTLNIVWIPDHGANGAALASTISYSVASVLFLIVYARITGISIREMLRYRTEDFIWLSRLVVVRRTIVISK